MRKFFIFTFIFFATFASLKVSADQVMIVGVKERLALQPEKFCFVKKYLEHLARKKHLKLEFVICRNEEGTLGEHVIEVVVDGIKYAADMATINCAVFGLTTPEELAMAVEELPKHAEDFRESVGDLFDDLIFGNTR